MRAFKAADRGNGGKLNKSSFRKMFEYLIFFNNVAHLFDRIDESGDGVLSLAEFKIGAHLYATSCAHRETALYPALQFRTGDTLHRHHTKRMDL